MVVKGFALHINDPSLIPGTPYAIPDQGQEWFLSISSVSSPPHKNSSYTYLPSVL